MKLRSVSVALTGFFLIVALCRVFAGAGYAVQETLDEILDQMSEKGAAISSMRAKITQKKWTDILEEFDRGEAGEFLFLRAKDGVYLRKDILDPQPNHLVIADGQAIFYQPRIKQVQKYNLGANKDKAEFLLIGFGTSRKSLEEAYEIRLLGRESVEGREAYVLELVPRSDRVSAFFSRIVLWIDPQLWVPVQQRLVEPTEDYLLVNFHDIEINPKLSPSDFRLKLPQDVKVVGG